MTYQELDLIIFKHILSSKKNALDFVHDSGEKLFMPDAWRFAKIILDYIKVYKEIPTRKVINERLKPQKNESLLNYVNQLWDDIDNVKVDDKEYKHDIEKIKNRFTERLITDLKDRLVGDDGRVDIKKSVSELNAAVNHIKGINQVKAYEQKTIKESIDDFRSRYVAKLHNPNIGVGLKTGYSFLDFIMGGIRKQEMVLIGAETGIGKSLLMMNIGINMWMGENTLDTEKDFKPGADILYFSLEMPYADMLERVLACIAKVPQTAIRDATLTEDQKKDLGKALKFIERYPHDFTIVDIPRGATMDGVELIFNDICATRNKKPQVIIIDYLALLSHDQKDVADWLQLNYLSEAFHEMIRTHDVVGITATQLNRPSANKGGPEQTGLHRLSRSALQAANSNFVILIDKRPNEQELPTMQLNLVKSRRTPLISGTIYKQLACCALLNNPTESIEASSSNAEDADISDIVE
jgi:replicative DNA helicase